MQQYRKNQRHIEIFKFMALSVAYLIGLTLPSLAAAQLTPISGGDCLGLPCGPGTDPLGLAVYTVVYIGIFTRVTLAIAVIFFLYAGYKYISSAGDEEAAAGAKRQIIYGVIGLFIVLASNFLASRSFFKVIWLFWLASSFVNFAIMLVGTAATIYLTYAGYKYISSAGDEAAAAQAKRQIIYAVIGTLLVTGAYTIRNAFVVFEGSGLGPTSATLGGSRIAALVEPLITSVIVLIGFAAAIYTVMAGIMYFSASGDEQRAAAAKQQLIYGTIGLVVLMASAALVNFVLNALYG
jgi:hypothetical protein